MENGMACIFGKNAVMKKISGIAASLMLVVIATNAQSDKKELPPPPPKPKEEKIKPPPPKTVDEKVEYKLDKVTKPKIVDEKVKVSPPPPKPKEQVKYKIVKNEEIKKPPVIKVTGKMADEFYEKNPSVSDISGQGNIITLKMKDGTTEKYDMSKKEEDKSFTDKYGKSPIPPPPPPPKVVVTKSKG